jgi:ribonuclease P/MRP protein subunit RPP40
MLHFDAAITDAASSNHAYDVIAVDFKKAFDKAPHECVLEAFKCMGVSGKAHHWFASFLQGRTQQVRVGCSLSSPCDVTSGVVQGSILGPVLYTLLTDSLLRQFSFPVDAFADDIKFLADVTLHTREEVQAEVDKLVRWCDSHGMQLSLEKTVVMHCGRHQPAYEYYIHGVKISSVDGFPDLGVHRSACGTYAGHCEALAAKASRVAGAVRKAFHSRSRALLWPAYQYYVLPLLMYMSPAWSPRLKRDVDRLERVQRRYTKMITELHGLPYLVRLRELQALTLSNMRTFADMVFVFKCLHGLVNFPATDIGFDLVTSITRGSGCRLKQRHINSATKNLFAVRAVTTWNSLPNNIIACKSIGQFKCMLRKHLISLQC